MRCSQNSVRGAAVVAAVLLALSAPAGSIPGTPDLAAFPGGAPSAVVAGLFALMGLEAGPADRAALSELDALPSEARASMHRFLDAFVEFHAAASAAFGAPPGEGSPGGPGPAELEAITEAQERMVSQALALRDALASTARTDRAITFQLPPVVAVDLTGEDSEYLDDLLLVVDVGGNDRYGNNAGGAGCSIVSTAAAVVDLDGHDRYENPRDCGVNGGGHHGAGFLMDAAGDDHYIAGRGGTNGGAMMGSGYLLDLEGNDVYRATNTAANGGIFLYTGAAGRGALIDLHGDDLYEVTGNRVGGGALKGENRGVWTDVRVPLPVGLCYGIADHPVGTSGLLLDGGGSDVYRDGAIACTDCSIVPKGLLGAQVDVPSEPGRR